jgi:hypothetical protein
MIDWDHFVVGDHRVPCPRCCEKKKDKSAGLTVNADRSGVMHCFRCGYVELHRSGHSAFRYESATVKPSALVSGKRESLSDWGWKIWNQCLPIGGVAAAYLQSRRCASPPKDSHLRWHPSLKHPTGYVGPALVALVTNALTGAALSLHRTWITEAGKASVNPPRMQLAGHTLASGVIRLWPDEYISYGLGVAEGIETALSLAHAYEPVWSLIDANHLSSFPVISGLETLMIAKDNDPVGRAAAMNCAQRWHAAGKKVLMTNQAANDLNDSLKDAA